MRYYIFLILITILARGEDSVADESARYRVEVLILTHLQHEQEPREVSKLADYSAALDFLQPPQEPSEADGADESETPAESTPEALAVETTADSAAEVPASEIEEDPWNVVIHVEEMGPEMQDAWRRLRLSGPFRPLQYLAWEQGSNAPFPVLRIHDLEPVLIEDPWAEQRQLQLETDQPTVFGDTVPPLGDEAEADAEDTEELPDPIVYYRLDGTVSLTRSRFLHLVSEIEWREPVFDETALTNPIAVPAVPGEPVPQPTPSYFRVYRLEQSRPVRTGRMEYFDGPVLGMLAWVSNISDTVVTEPAD